MEARPKLPLYLERNLFNILIVVFVTILYAPIILHWYDGWLSKSISIDHEYFSHGMLGFPFAAYITWSKRQEWQRLEPKFHPLGGVLLGLGAAFYLTGVAELVHISLPLVLAGICLWLKGIPGLKLQAFPLLFVFLATPNSVPYLITPYILPLQKFIASVAGFLLVQLGFEVRVDEIYLAVNGKQVEVAPYCAGLKMLFTSLYFSLILLYWTGDWQNRNKTSLLVSGTIAISVIANIIRNTILSFFHGTGQQERFEWLHDGWGGDLYSGIMLLGIIILLIIINRVIIVEPDRQMTDST